MAYWRAESFGARIQIDLHTLRLGDADAGDRCGGDENNGECNPLEHGVPLWFRGCGMETDAPRMAGRPDSGGATSTPWGKHLNSTA